MMSKRVWWLDLARGWTIFFVVLAHSVQGVFKTGAFHNYDLLSEILMFLVFTFIMPVFFAISGYLYKHIMTGKQLVGQTRNKLITFIVPYITFSAVYVFLQHFSGGVHHLYTVKDLSLIFVQPIGYMWFIYALFFVFVVNYILDLVHMSDMMKLFVSVALFAIKSVDGLPLFMAVTFTWMICFNIGIMLKNDESLFESKRIALALLSVMVISFYIQIRVGGSWYSTNTLAPINFISKLASVPLAFFVFQHSSHNFINDFMARYGKYSLIIYLVHAPAASIVRVVLMKIGISNYFALCIMVVVFSYAISLIAVKLAEKSDLIKFFFYPRPVLSNLMHVATPR